MVVNQMMKALVMIMLKYWIMKLLNLQFVII